MLRHYLLALFVLALALPCEAQFDWGSGCGNGGSGSFNQPVAHNAILTVGEIISGLRDVRINLKSSTDIDVQLYDKSNGHAIVKWPDGQLNGPGFQSVSYGGVTIAWSGFNGDGSGLGNEYIDISGTTDRSYVMKVYGFQAGSAAVTYSWAGGGGSGGCDGGKGSFQQQINQNALIDIGDIPNGLEDVYISLASPRDVDVQLIDKATGFEIVAWPNGRLSGSGPETTTYDGMTVVWSGYDGDQVNDRRGYEFIAIHGKTTRTLVMKAFGFQAGFARVDYTWGKRYVVYSGIQGAAEYAGSQDGSVANVREASGCSRITEFVTAASGSRNPNSTSDLTAIAGTDLGGLWAVGYRIACGSQFKNNSRAALYKPGNSTLVKLDIEKYYNEKNGRVHVYLAGFSAGGGDLQNLEFNLQDLGIPVQLGVHIDSIEFGSDALIASNVRRAMGFFQNEAHWPHGENLLWTFDQTKTFITNTRVSGPAGPATSSTASLNYQHRNMDNDERTWKPLIEYLNLHR